LIGAVPKLLFAGAGAGSFEFDVAAGTFEDTEEEGGLTDAAGAGFGVDTDDEVVLVTSSFLFLKSNVVYI
jgi:hypothetical protein